MAQEFENVNSAPGGDTVRVAIERLLDRTDALTSSFSGDTFPALNIFEGMKCYRTDLETKFYLQNMNPVTWIHIPDIIENNTLLANPNLSNIQLPLTNAIRNQLRGFTGTNGIDGPDGALGGKGGIQFTFSDNVDNIDPGDGVFKFDNSLSSSILQMYLNPSQDQPILNEVGGSTSTAKDYFFLSSRDDNSKKTIGYVTGIGVPGLVTASWTGNLRVLGPDNVGRKRFGCVNTSGNFSGLISGFDLPTDWIDGGGNAFVRNILLYGTANVGGSVSTVNLSSSDSGDGYDAGPDLTSISLNHLRVKITVGNSSLEFSLVSGNNPDDSEPYAFVPALDEREAIEDFVDDLPLGLQSSTVEFMSSTQAIGSWYAFNITILNSTDDFVNNDNVVLDFLKVGNKGDPLPSFFVNRFLRYEPGNLNGDVLDILTYLENRRNSGVPLPTPPDPTPPEPTPTPTPTPTPPNMDLRGPTTILPDNEFADAYAFISDLWPNRPGRTITWSNATLNIPSDRRQSRITGPLEPADVLTAQRAAFDYWESQLNVNFEEVTDAESVNIRCGMDDNMDNRYVGFATRWRANGIILEQTITYNPTYLNVNHFNRVFYLNRTLEHEVGHTLGLGHPDELGDGGDISETIMETISHSITDPQDPQLGDLIGGLHLYGPATSVDAIAPDVVDNYTISITDTRIQVTWNTPIINGGQSVTGYTIRVEKDGSFITNANVAANVTQYTRNLENGEWVFTVNASNSVGAGLLKRASISIQPPNTTFNITGTWRRLSNDMGYYFSGSIQALPSAWFATGILGHFQYFNILDDGQIAFGISSQITPGDTIRVDLLSVAETDLFISLDNGAYTTRGITDTSEPYNWYPAPQSEIETFVANLTDGDSAQITLRY